MKKHRTKVFGKLIYILRKKPCAACRVSLRHTLPLALAGVVLLTAALPVQAEETGEALLEKQRAMPVESNEVDNWPTGPTVGAEAAILMEADTGAILYSKNIHKKEYPASTTKLLTCLIAAEQSSMDETVAVTRTAVESTPYDSSHIAMDPGEEITMEQALNAILIASANEVSFAVGEHISGTWQKFAELMNSRARELGCTDSNFINPNGLPDENHYTSAYDLAQIARAFFDIDLLCRISSSTRLHIPPTDTQPDNIIHNSTNQLLKGRPLEYEYLVGSKTGYTEAARSCLVSCAEKDGMRLICVVMKDESPLQFEDTISLFDYGFSNFDRVNVSQTETQYDIGNSGVVYSDNDIFGSSRPILSLDREDCIILPKTISFSDTVSSISYDTPREGQAAEIRYTYRDVYLGAASVDLAGYDSREYASGGLPMKETADGKGDARSSSVVYINIVRVTQLIIGTAAVVLIFFLCRSFIKKINLPRENTRRAWRRDRRRNQPRPQPVSAGLREKRRQQSMNARKRRKTGRKGR